MKDNADLAIELWLPPHIVDQTMREAIDALRQPESIHTLSQLAQQHDVAHVMVGLSHEDGNPEAQHLIIVYRFQPPLTQPVSSDNQPFTEVLKAHIPLPAGQHLYAPLRRSADAESRFHRAIQEKGCECVPFEPSR